MTNLTAERLSTLPRVNLLPPEIAEQRRGRRVQVGLGAGLLATLGVVGAMTILANTAVGNAEDELAAAKARGSQLQAQQKQYAEVPVVYAQVEAAQAQLNNAMGQEVRWSYFLNDISLSVPSKVWLTSMTVTQEVDAASEVAPTAATGEPENFLAAGLGTVTFEGRGTQHNDVAAWLNALARQKGMSQPYFTSSTKEPIGDEDAVTFSSQATITEDALSKRYTQRAGS